MPKQLLPYEVKQALIEVCGRSFWYKQPLFDMFARAGIPEDLYLQYENEGKFKICRQLIGDLEQMGDDGMAMQRRLLSELCRLRDLPDKEVPNRDAGLRALRTLKAEVLRHDLAVCEEKSGTARRKADASSLAQRAQNRQARLQELNRMFVDLTTADDRQARGYDLEDLLSELFAAHEMRYRKSFKADGEQIDGFFAFGGFDYLVEARWRQKAPKFGELAEIRGKVERKIESTRGFVVSIAPFDQDVLRRLREAGPANLILMDGYDLSLILEGRVSLLDALQAKADKAAQEGRIYFPLFELFGQ